MFSLSYFKVRKQDEGKDTKLSILKFNFVLKVN